MLKSKLDQLKAKDGFTIIEVIIVLVIAAIIMLAVFLVVPQLQRTQRNSRRQNDARRVLAAGEQFAANSSGFYPTQTGAPTGIDTACSASVNTTNCAPIANITGDVTSPANAVYTISATAGASNMNITYNTQTCTNNAVAAATNSGKFVVSIYLENANTNTANYATTSTTWCIGN